MRVGQTINCLCIRPCLVYILSEQSCSLLRKTRMTPYPRVPTVHSNYLHEINPRNEKPNKNEAIIAACAVSKSHRKEIMYTVWIAALTSTIA